MSTWEFFLFLFVNRTYFCKGTNLDNKGTEFIIGFPENVNYRPAKPIFLINTESSDDVLVHITAPKFTGTIIDHHKYVSSEKSWRLKLPRKLRIKGTDIVPNALYITAEQEVSVFAVNPEQHSNDAFLALPTDVLGREYYAMTWFQTTQTNNTNEILIIGINDSTILDIHLPNLPKNIEIILKGRKYGSNGIITETINRYDIFQIQALTELSGTHITSNKVIGVVSGNVRTYVGGKLEFGDHLVEMLPPVNTYGKTFITVPFPEQISGDILKVLASQNNTLITIQKGRDISNYTIQTAGETYVFDSLQSRNVYCFIRSNKPVLLMQFVKSQDVPNRGRIDPSMMTIPPFELYSSNYSFTTPKSANTKSYVNYFMFTIKADDKDGLRLDGTPIITSNAVIDGTDYVGGYIRLKDGIHHVYHDSPSASFAGYLFGVVTHESYAVPVGMRMKRINTVNKKPKVNTGVSDNCECQCTASFVSNKKLNETRPKLKVSKKETSRYRASKISVHDNRPSAVALGSGFAIFLLVIPLALIVISDVPLLIKHMRSRTS